MTTKGITNERGIPMYESSPIFDRMKFVVDGIEVILRQRGRKGSTPPKA
jgi:hypothetical protein